MLYGYYDQDSHVRDSNNSPWLGSVRDGRDDKPTHKLVRPAPHVVAKPRPSWPPKLCPSGQAMTWRPAEDCRGLPTFLALPRAPQF